MSRKEFAMNTGINMADSLWAWVTEYPDGSVGLIAVTLNIIEDKRNHRGPALTPLIGRSESAIRKMEPYAYAHGKALNQKVWLRRYDMTVDYPND
jgi:hypothetical protein